MYCGAVLVAETGWSILRAARPAARARAGRHTPLRFPPGVREGVRPLCRKDGDIILVLRYIDTGTEMQVHPRPTATVPAALVTFSVAWHDVARLRSCWLVPSGLR